MMKRLACAVMMGGLASGAWLAPAFCAQGGGGGPRAGGKGAHRMMSPEKLKDNLGLSDEQLAKLEAARKAHAEAVKPLREQMKAGMEKLRGQVKNKAADADIQATMDELSQGRKSMQQAREKFQEDLKSFLNPTQRAKMLLHAMKAMRQGQWQGKGGKGRGPQGMPPAPEAPDDEGGEMAP